ncbi:MAG: hypothetical protein HY717_15935 [Planctomycetes bacterium]|nr:hypothetical protein [Planctomycetota bacterium]
MPTLLRSKAPFIAALLLPLAGCLFYPGKKELELLEAKRGAPYAVTVFSRNPGPAAEPPERPLAELRQAMLYWASPGSEEKPRWQGVLAPHPEDLYQRVLQAMDQGQARITLTAYQYDATGLDYLTLVDYAGENGSPIGWDTVDYPAPPPPRQRPLMVGFADLRWWEYPQMIFDLPFYLAIGLKELAGEIVKSPLSAIDSGWIGTAVENRNPLSPVNFERAAMAFAEDWQDGFTALTFRLRVHHRHTPLDTLQEFLGILPIAGPVFDHKSPPDDSAPPPATTLIAVGQGIHAGGREELFTLAWERAIKEARPEAVVTRAPYCYGGVFDVIWSMLNLSNGLGYDLAAYLVFEEGLGPGEGVELAGFSGSAQKEVAASRVLRSAGIAVNKLIGVAGPVAGFSCARESHLLLGTDPLADPVILAEHAENALIPLFPSNLRVQWIPGAGGHHIPYFPNPATRAPESGYRRALEDVIKR